jgi:hypothetical protein
MRLSGFETRKRGDFGVDAATDPGRMSLPIGLEGRGTSIRKRD